MLFLTNSKNDKKHLQRFISFDKESKTYNDITLLQNELIATGETKVIIVTSANDDYLASAFAKALSHTFDLNGEKTLVIDANLYEPQLPSFLFGSEEASKKVNSISSKTVKAISIDEKSDAICFEKETYPSECLKKGAIEKLIKKNEEKYDHLIIICPNVDKHDDFLLLEKDADCTLLVVRRNITERALIYNAINQFKDNNFPLPKTVIIK